MFTKTYGHRHGVTAVGVSPNGEYACSGDSAGNLAVWEIRHDQLVLRNSLRPAAARVASVVINDEGGGYAGVGPQMHKFGHGESKRLGEHRHEMMAAFFSAGYATSMSRAGSVRIWGGGIKVPKLPQPYGAACLSGTFVVSCRDQALLFRPGNWAGPQAVDLPPAAAFAQGDGRIYAGCLDGTVREVVCDGHFSRTRVSVQVVGGYAGPASVVRPDVGSTWRVAASYSLEGGEITGLAEVGGGLFVATDRGLVLLRPRHPQVAEDISAGIAGTVTALATDALKSVVLAGVNAGTLCLWRTDQPGLRAALAE